MKRSTLLLLFLILSTKIVYAQYSKKIDTVCVNYYTAKRLAFYKLNYKRIDSLYLKKSFLLDACNDRLRSKDSLNFNLQLQNAELKIENSLLLKKINIKETDNEPNFKIKFKYFTIGFGVATLSFGVYKLLQL